MDLLEKTLGHEACLPSRKVTSIQELQELIGTSKELYFDVTERPIRRPSDNELQKEKYSGKKKRHTVKNLAIADNKKRILFLSGTASGKVHDYTLFKETELGDKMTSKKVKNYFDLGFQGVKTDFPNMNVMIPNKKPRNKELTSKQKKKNKKMSRKRIVVEHSFGGVKRMGVVSNIYRNIKPDFCDKVMLISTGLWNFHLKYT